MKYSKLGKTDLSVSAVGFGGIPIQRITQKEIDDVIAACHDEGINFIDTAVGYTTSEESIGRALKNRANNFVIASKSMARTKEGILAHVDASLKKMQLDHIDLYQFHNLRSEDDLQKVFGESGAMEGLLEAQKAGKIRHIGATFHPLAIAEKFLEKCSPVSVMFPYNIVENQGEKMFEYCNKNSISTIAMKPLAGGAIENGTLAMKYILANENVSVAIPGMASVKEVEENARCGDRSPLSESDLAGIEEIKDILKGDFCRRCDYCKPCPSGIDIPLLQTFESYFTRYNLKDWAKERYAGVKVKASACTSCKTCEKRCPYELKIAEKMKHIAEIFEQNEE